MKKEQIINIAKTLDFKLDYDKFDDKEYPGDSNNLRYLRFVSIDDSLHEKELTWIWYKEDSDNDNIQRGLNLQHRLKRKKDIQNLLKY